MSNRIQRATAGWLAAPLVLLLAGCASPSGGGSSMPALAGTRWDVTSIDGKVPLGPAPTAEFSNDGRISGDAGCNSYSGPFIQDGRKVQIGELLSTRRACADDARQRQEDRLLKILQGSANLQMRRNRLTVQSDDGAVVLSERR